MGYSHREIAADEHATATTTNKQITRAKRLLRTAADDSLAAAGPLITFHRRADRRLTSGRVAVQRTFAHSQPPARDRA